MLEGVPFTGYIATYKSSLANAPTNWLGAERLRQDRDTKKVFLVDVDKTAYLIRPQIRTTFQVSRENWLCTSFLRKWYK